MSPRADTGSTTSCPFCRIVAGTGPAHVVADDPDAVAFLDTRPVFPGHTLVVPRRHVVTLTDTTDADLTPVMDLARRCAAAVKEALGAQGSFVAMNNTVSQSVAHLHVHVVPRTKGDGLRGFFWPRTKYPDDATAAEVASRLRDALGS